MKNSLCIFSFLFIVLGCKSSKIISQPITVNELTINLQKKTYLYIDLKSELQSKTTNIKISSGSKIVCPSGDCLIRSHLLMESNDVVFLGKGNFIFELGTVDYLCPSNFGAEGDGVNDDSDAIQRTIDAAIKSNGIGNIRFKGGIYRISKPIIIGKKLDGRFEFFNLTIEGMQAPFTDSWYGNVPLLISDFDEGFVFGLQSCRGVFLRNLAFKGKAEFNHDLKEIFEIPIQNLGKRSFRNERYSPYSAIVIDPFHENTLSENRYPGLSEYKLKAPGSSYVKIENCKISNFDIGICISPNGFSTQGDNISINDLHVDHCKYGISICQSQSRSVQVNNIAANNINILFDAVTFGAQQGQLPIVNVGTISQIKWIYKCSNGFAYGQFRAIYGEEIYGLGFSTNPYGKMPVNFDQCVFHFTYPLNIKTKNTLANPALLQGFSASFNACFLGYDIDITKRAPLNFDVVNLSFSDCTLDVPITNSNLDRHSKNTNVQYNNISFRNYLSDANFTTNGVIRNLASNVLADCMLAPGQKALDDKGVTYINKNQNPDWYLVDEAVVFRPLQKTLDFVFKSRNPGLFSNGDALYLNLPNSITGVGNTVRTCIGFVSRVDGDNVVIEGATYGIPDTKVDVYVQRHPYLKPRMFGKTVKDSREVQIVNTNDKSFQFYKVGDKINCQNIKQGSYVQSINNRVITLSHPANKSGFVILEDADIMLEKSGNQLPIEGIWKAGDIVLNDFSNNKDIYKWLCTKSGSYESIDKPIFKSN